VSMVYQSQQTNVRDTKVLTENQHEITLTKREETFG
jgi:hypothetical protein